MELKGFYFSMDAVMGLMVIGLGTGLIASTSQISEGVPTDELRFNQYSEQAVDISYLMRNEDFSSLNQTYRDELIDTTSLERNRTETIAESILQLHRNGDPEASELAENYMSSFDYDSGLNIEGSELVALDSTDTASASFFVSARNQPYRFTVVVGE